MYIWYSVLYLRPILGMWNEQRFISRGAGTPLQNVFFEVEMFDQLSAERIAVKIFLPGCQVAPFSMHGNAFVCSEVTAHIYVAKNKVDFLILRLMSDRNPMVWWVCLHSFYYHLSQDISIMTVTASWAGTLPLHQQYLQHLSVSKPLNQVQGFTSNIKPDLWHLY